LRKLPIPASLQLLTTLVASAAGAAPVSARKMQPNTAGRRQGAGKRRARVGFECATIG